MKKALLIALLAAALLGFGPARAVAEETPQQPECLEPPPPGCDCKIFKAMENKADVEKVNKQGTDAEVGKKPDPVEKLACLDQALSKITGSLGKMFSNMAFDPTVTPGANMTAFCGLVSYPSLPTMNLASHLSMMIPSLASLIPAFQVQLCTPPTPSPPQLHISFGGSLGGCSILTSLATPQVPKPPPLCISITTPGMNCLQIKSKWTGGEASIEQNGIVMGAPYMTFQDLVNSAADSNDADLQKMGDQFKRKMDVNRVVLERAKNDLMNMEEPGHMKSWKPSPAFGANSTVEEIIQEMGHDPPSSPIAGGAPTLPNCMPTPPALPDLPALPTLPALPATPDLSGLPDLPALPGAPPIPIPSLPTGQIPGIPNVTCLPQ